MQNYNLSGTITVPFPQDPNIDNNPSGNYTINTRVYAAPKGGDYLTSPVNQTISMTNSSGSPLTGQRFPYQGCTFILNKFKDNAAPANHINEASADSCSGVIPSECQGDILRIMNATALRLAEEPTITGEDACSLFPIASMCKHAPFSSWGSRGMGPLKPPSNILADKLISVAIFSPHPDTTDVSQTCHQDSILGPQLPGQLWLMNRDQKSLTKLSNEATPCIVTTAWRNATHEEQLFARVWANTQMFCIVPNKVVSSLASRETVTGTRWVIVLAGMVAAWVVW